MPTSVNSTYTGPIPGAYASSPLAQIAGLGSVLGAVSNTKLGGALGTGIGNIWDYFTKDTGQAGGLTFEQLMNPPTNDYTYIDADGNPQTGTNDDTYYDF